MNKYRSPFFLLLIILISSCGNCQSYKDQNIAFQNQTQLDIGKDTSEKIQFFSLINIKELLGIAEFCCNRLKNVDTLIVQDDKMPVYEQFDFFSKEAISADPDTNSSSKYSYYNYYTNKNIWGIKSKDRKNDYQYYFYDTTNISIGIAYVSTFDQLHNKSSVRKAPGFLILFKDIKASYFIGVLNDRFLFYKITTIQYLNTDLIPLTQIRFGRWPSNPPVAEFVSRFNYDTSMVYQNEMRLQSEPLVLQENSYFYHIARYLKIHEKQPELGLVRGGGYEHNDVIPWFWSSTSLYDPY